ncbi:hypothetical protein [Lyngbya confervoides]|uniref:Glycosyl transferase n=1 Tax=Lyngbya confervoides BDU141951 TaxID=1574623 RepID=A0ABD4T3I5_9CYAN|nr:hypothetical protein [Lyngbya confervoides]MCM1983008.1 hypothetical protein [Lyngbya confervoides BDU141951]
MVGTATEAKHTQKLHQCVYALTSSGNDIFADMTQVSMLSLRLSNPNMKIILSCDSASKAALDRCKNPVLEVCDTVIDISTPESPASFRNRYIKTSLRQHLSGPFLYLDADTIIRGDLSEVFQTTASFAAAPNHSGSGDPAEMPGNEKEKFISLGWQLPDKHYVNGGVLFFAERPEVYDFCNLWHQKWLACSEKTGKHYDQPSLNSAIHDSRINFTWLKHRFNAQVHARPHTAWGAAIWHIYLSEPHASPETEFGEALIKLRQEQSITAAEVANLCQQSHPWTVKNPIDVLAVQSLKHQSTVLNGDRWERLWLANQYGKGVRQLLNQYGRAVRKLLPLRAWARQAKHLLKSSFTA